MNSDTSHGVMTRCAVSAHEGSPIVSGTIGMNVKTKSSMRNVALFAVSELTRPIAVM